MLAILDTAVVHGLRGELVRVEVDITSGLPMFSIVGLPDTALSEARERVRGALRNSGFEYPLSRITVNLAPAHRRKSGAAYDVAIAVGILLANRQIRASGGPWALLGELSLDGSVRPVPGVLPMVATLQAAGHRRVCVPTWSVAEAALVEGIEVVGVEGLDDVARLIAGPGGRKAAQARRRTPIRVARVAGDDRAATLAETDATELADLRGQEHARWALEVAITGRHNMLLVGPPGAGKTMLARAAPRLQPPLTEVEAREVAVIRSVSGLEAPVTRRRVRPFRAPHHTTSYAAMVGGGPRLRPGLVTQAHHGILFLDELAEFDRHVLDALRQPLEDGAVEIVRAHGAVTYPARLQLIAAMNPCRCGWHGDGGRTCRCPLREPERYRRRVSGPLLDRIDLRVIMPRVEPHELVSLARPEPSRIVARRVEAAWSSARERNQGLPNAALQGRQLLRVCALDAGARRALDDLGQRLELTARGIHRTLRVARTIADLHGRTAVGEEELAAAAALRDRTFEPAAAA